jgi:hypothetical protein
MSGRRTAIHTDVRQRLESSPARSVEQNHINGDIIVAPISIARSISISSCSTVRGFDEDDDADHHHQHLVHSQNHVGRRYSRDVIVAVVRPKAQERALLAAVADCALHFVVYGDETRRTDSAVTDIFRATHDDTDRRHSSKYVRYVRTRAAARLVWIGQL